MIELIIISLAAWYVAYTITRLSGPFNVFGRVRDWSRRNIKAGDGAKNGSLAEMIECIYCTAFWSSALLYAIWVLTPFQSIVYVFAAAGGLLAINRWIDS